MAASRHKPSSGNSRSVSKNKRRHHYKNSAEAERDSDLDSRSTISSSEGSTCVPVAPSTRHRHGNDSHCDEDSRRSHSSYRHRKHHRRHQPKALPTPDEEDEKTGYPTAVVLREEYPVPVQTAPRTPQRALSVAEEEVYDHRSRPLSRRRREQSEPPETNTAGHGFCMAAVMVVVSLFICMGEADE